jgi:hypothetical protein
MRTSSTFFAAAALFVAATAGAQEATPDTWIHEHSTPAPVVARSAAVKPQAAAAAVTPAAGKTRAEVKAELEAARRSGELAQLSAEAYSFPSAPARIAAPVMAQVK